MTDRKKCQEAQLLVFDILYFATPVGGDLWEGDTSPNPTGVPTGQLGKFQGTSVLQNGLLQVQTGSKTKSRGETKLVPEE